MRNDLWIYDLQSGNQSLLPQSQHNVDSEPFDYILIDDYLVLSGFRNTFAEGRETSVHVTQAWRLSDMSRQVEMVDHEWGSPERVKRLVVSLGQDIFATQRRRGKWSVVELPSEEILFSFGVGLNMADEAMSSIGPRMSEPVAVDTQYGNYVEETGCVAWLEFDSEGDRYTYVHSGELTESEEVQNAPVRHDLTGSVWMRKVEGMWFLFCEVGLERPATGLAIFQFPNLNAATRLIELPYSEDFGVCAFGTENVYLAENSVITRYPLKRVVQAAFD